MKIVSFIKQYKKQIIVVAAIIFLLLLSAVSFRARRTTTGPSQTPAPTAAPQVKEDWGALSEMTAHLKEPVQDAVENGTGVREFSTENKSENDEVYYQGGTPIFYKDIVLVKEGKKGASIRAKYGQPEIRLFGGMSEFGYFLYAYPSKGIAYVANGNTDTITEIWYFQKTDTEGLLLTWAKEYTKEPSEGQF